MSNAIQQSIVALEAEMSVLTQRLTDIDAALMALRRLAGPMSEAAPKDLPAPLRHQQPEPEHEPQVRTPKIRTTLSNVPSEDREARLLACLRDRDGQSSGELAALIGEHGDRAKFELAKMAKKGLIHRTGTGPRNFRWYLGVGASTSRKRPAKEAVQ